MDKTQKEKRPDSLSSNNKTVDKTFLKPVTVNNILYYYCPIVGTASYTLLSINVLNPTLQFSFLTKRDLTTFFLLNSVVGAGCYIHSRPHLKLTSPNSRLGYSAFGSVLFSFSSVLVWAILRSLIPENLGVGTVVGVATSYIFVKGATNYLDFVDTKVMK